MLGSVSNPIRQRLSQLWSSALARSTGILVGGTAIGHLLTLIVMPINTRLYAPQDFGIAATFASIVAIVVSAACLRFDMAITLPETDDEAINLLAVSLASVGTVTFLTAVVAVGISVYGTSIGIASNIVHIIWFLPIAVAMGGAYLALQMWFVRTSEFHRIAHSRIVQSAAAGSGQISFGLVSSGPVGLVIGQILNTGGGSLMLGLSLLRRQKAILRKISLMQMRAVTRRYDRFPKYSVWEALANGASVHLPILLIASVAKPAELGYLSLSIFLLQAPMSLIGNAIGQVYLANAPAAHREGRLGAYTLNIARTLSRIVAVPMTMAALLAPILFTIVFGSTWERAGVLVTWMAPWFALQFITSPVSTALHVTGKQRLALLLQLFGLMSRVGAVYLAAELDLAISEAYALSGAVFYLIYLFTVSASLKISASSTLKLVSELVLCAGIVALLFTSIKEVIVNLSNIT